MRFYIDFGRVWRGFWKGLGPSWRLLGHLGQQLFVVGQNFADHFVEIRFGYDLRRIDVYPVEQRLHAHNLFGLRQVLSAARELLRANRVRHGESGAE